MQIYLVGGAVRDTLLGLPVTDRDWVVVGGTPQQLVDLGFVPVGKDFPVFLHPRSREQYALARTERKTAPGYRGFAIHAAPDVTLEQDLARRDLTINAIAVAAEFVPGDGSFDPAHATLTDPHHGLRDLQRQQLRHVSDAFREDPVRILRVARFAARFTGFAVATETMDLMRAMVVGGEVAALVPERVWQELASGLMEATPSRMFDVLRLCGALAILLPEVDALWPQPASAGESGSESGSGPNSFGELGSNTISFGTYLRFARVLDLAAQQQLVLPVRFACLCLRLAPVAGNAKALAANAIRRLCQRLPVPTDCRELAEVAARESDNIHGSAALDAQGLVHLLERCDAFRKPGRFADLLLACACAARAETTDRDAPYPPHQQLARVLAAAQAVTTNLVAARARAAGLEGPQVGAMIHAERVAAVAAMLH